MTISPIANGKFNSMSTMNISSSGMETQKCHEMLHDVTPNNLVHRKHVHHAIPIYHDLVGGSTRYSTLTLSYLD